MGNVVESTTLTEPPSSAVAFVCESGKMNGLGTWPWGSDTAFWLSGGAAISVASQPMPGVADGGGMEHPPLGKMYSCREGMWSKADMFTLKFFARTSFGTWASQSVSCKPDRDARTHTRCDRRH